MQWALKHDNENVDETSTAGSEFMNSNPPFAVQLVRQVNFGRLESKRYFVPLPDDRTAFAEVTEDDLISSNFQKLNS